MKYLSYLFSVVYWYFESLIFLADQFSCTQYMHFVVSHTLCPSNLQPQQITGISVDLKVKMAILEISANRS